MTTAGRTPLHIGFNDLSIGRHSVGMPTARTGEHVVQAYADLIRLLRRDRPEFLREDDVAVIASETKLGKGFIRNRVNSYLAA